MHQHAVHQLSKSEVPQKDYHKAENTDFKVSGDLKDNLNAMGRFFDINPVRVKFYIKTLELQGKI